MNDWEKIAENAVCTIATALLGFDELYPSHPPVGYQAISDDDLSPTVDIRDPVAIRAFLIQALNSFDDGEHASMDAAMRADFRGNAEERGCHVCMEVADTDPDEWPPHECSREETA